MADGVERARDGDSDDFYIYKIWSWPLAVLGWINHFGVLAPLAVLGVVLIYPQRDGCGCCTRGPTTR